MITLEECYRIYENYNLITICDDEKILIEKEN